MSLREWMLRRWTSLCMRLSGQAKRIITLSAKVTLSFDSRACNCMSQRTRNQETAYMKQRLLSTGPLGVCFINTLLERDKCAKHLSPILIFSNNSFFSRTPHNSTVKLLQSQITIDAYISLNLFYKYIIISTMAPLPQRPQSPLPQTRGNLTFGSNGLMVNGDVPYTTLSQLKAMLSIPGRLRAPAVTDRWIRGQLELYSIPYDSQLSGAQLSGALELAIRGGNVSR